MAHFLDSPATVADSTRHMDHTDVDFTNTTSFQEPEGRDSLFKQMRGARQPASTPRNPLAALRNANARNEFTPMLKSATANRTKQVSGLLNGTLATPAAMKPGFRLSNTPLPEASTFDAMNSSAMSASIDERTPMPEAASSSALSTPHALPRRRDGEVDLGNGNVLTLREQEARLAEIDKENFGLKLKIHFLEENLQKAGPESNATALKENITLKTEKVMMLREIKGYSKDMKSATRELDSYKQQLREYAEKVKRRHADEGMREEMEDLRRVAEDRANEVDDLKAELEEVRRDRDDQANEDLHEELDELRRLAEERADEIDQLKAELEDVRCDRDDRADEEMDELRHLAEQRAAEINGLKAKLEEVRHDRDDRADEEMDELRRLAEQRATEIDELHAKLDHVRDDQDEMEALRQLAEERGAQLQEVRDAQKEMDELRQLLEKRAADVKALEEELEEYERAVEKHAAELDQARNSQDEVRELHRLVEDRAAELKGRDARVAELAAEIQELHQVRHLAEERTAKVEELERRIEESRYTQRKLEEVQRLAASRLAEVETLEARLDKGHNAEDEVIELREQVKLLKRELDESERRWKTSAEALRGSNHGLTQQLQAAEEQVNTLRPRMAELEAQNQELEDEVAVIQEEVEQAAQLSEKLSRDSYMYQAQMAELNTELNASRTTVLGLQKQIRGIPDRLQSTREELEQKDIRHQKELRGMTKLIQYLRASCYRSEHFRESLAHQKGFFLMQIDQFSQCNRHDLSLIEDMGIKPDHSVYRRKVTFKVAALAVRATMRMGRMSQNWAVNKKIRKDLDTKLQGRHRFVS
ncbi:hypothetical protein P154DRAFT_582238 [Amniculicola lignicola CBS 123094]|uniref:Centrosomin N-terminal motif 1 domain-containing protein n=1 Tax=Amniculicola lignicola CBS 123094 TaxID=1392246 RepID=A0A6A5W8P3_9PLEO|nr:hypothetical protein P154DRAFT_582238 [Amniculicola lignicola CBS 123094]